MEKEKLNPPSSNFADLELETECTEHSVTIPQAFKTEDVVSAHNNGNKTMLQRTANYCSCIALAVDVSRQRG